MGQFIPYFKADSDGSGYYANREMEKLVKIYRKLKEETEIEEDKKYVDEFIEELVELD